jgi:FtsP/CotA-like multicopper oxidase with cupredoxin domain
MSSVTRLGRQIVVAAALLACRGGFGTVLASEPVRDVCPRSVAGAVAADPEDLRSRNGVLQVDLTARNEIQKDGSTRYCYLLGDGNQSPTLRMKPGDLLVLRLKNNLSDLKGDPKDARRAHVHEGPHAAADPCTSATMTVTSTNLHFHGLTIPPVCHQDDVLRTSIQPGDPPFEYRFRIPDDEAPGLYWYHPHIHGFSSQQVLGGASGALIIEGIERANPEVAGLPERVLVIRDQDLAKPDTSASSGNAAMQAFVDADGDAINAGTGGGKPAKDLSVNYVPVTYPNYSPATLTLRPGERQLWRVLNATSVTYLNLAALVKRGPKFRAQWLGVVGIDGVPINANGSPGHATEWLQNIVVAPGARVEFIMVGPPVGAPAMLVTRWVDTGETGENDPNRPLISIVASADAPEPHSLLPKVAEPLPPPARPWIGSVRPTRERRLYFSEDAPDPKNPSAPTHFYLTLDGQTPKAFDPSSITPNIVVKQGDVEDWIIENRSPERHAFHIHQIHFQLVEWLGLAANESFVRDTINVPFHNAAMKSYPSVRIRMDFRDPNTVGTFVYHCHLLDHEDGGMMGLITVEPQAQ